MSQGWNRAVAGSVGGAKGKGLVSRLRRTWAIGAPLAAKATNALTGSCAGGVSISPVCWKTKPG